MKRITFLGTGTSTGVPVIGCQCPRCKSSDPRDKRLRSSAFIEVDGVKLVIDAGPDFRTQMLRANINWIDGLLISHLHFDHIGGIDDLRGLNYIMRSSINIYAEHMHAEGIRRTFPYCFVENKYPGVPKIDIIEIHKEPFEIKGIKIEPLRVIHGKMPILGYKFDNWAYITDASALPDSTIERLKGLDLLVINALRPEPHMSHFSLSEALEVIEKVKPRRAYLTHINHDFGNYNDIAHTLPEGVFIAYDGLTVE